MNRILRNLAVFASLVVVFGLVPMHASAALVTCGQGAPLNADGTQACGFPQFIQLISGLIDFLIFTVEPIVAVCFILYAGFLYLTSLDSAEKRKQANGMFVNVAVGLVISMTAWIIVKFILVNLGVDTSVFPVFY